MKKNFTKKSIIFRVKLFLAMLKLNWNFTIITISSSSNAIMKVILQDATLLTFPTSLSVIILFQSLSKLTFFVWERVPTKLHLFDPASPLYL